MVAKDRNSTVSIAVKEHSSVGKGISFDADDFLVTVRRTLIGLIRYNVLARSVTDGKYYSIFESEKQDEALCYAQDLERQLEKAVLLYYFFMDSGERNDRETV